MASVATVYAQEPYNWEKDLHHRLQYDFKRTREDVVKYIQQYIPDVTEQQILNWESTNALEGMDIDGKHLYFRNAAPNLFRVDKTCRNIKNKKEGVSLSNSQKAVIKNMPEVNQ